jgi:hypothetical protein
LLIGTVPYLKLIYSIIAAAMSQWHNVKDKATPNLRLRRVKLNADPWDRTGRREIGYCYPMGAGFGPITMRGGEPLNL